MNEYMNEEKISILTKMFQFIVLLILYQPIEGDTSPITCYNDQGDAVDWLYIYKLPKQHGSKAPDNGQKYLLMERGSEGWTEGKGKVNDSTGALGRTVGQLYAQQKSAEVAYILYNDQRPPRDPGARWLDDTGSRGGHTKGVVLLDKTQGFWLVHSTPQFPPVQQAGQYYYPSSGVINGQNFICVTYPLDRFQTIGEQLQINQPNVYDCHIPESLASLAPALAAVCKKSSPANHVFPHVKPVSNRSVTLTSAQGTNFISFAKGASFANDLYHSWVAPTLKSDLLVQFWVRSTGILPSDCSLGWKVLDVKLISPGQTFTFKASQDHSKWAVSAKAAGRGGVAGGWVCVGDINRDEAEEKRGGGTVCLRDPAVWKAYRSAALECELCGGQTDKCDASATEPARYGLGVYRV
ncbi:deoxyribonuclease-2-alpha [Polymixia lowei]